MMVPAPTSSGSHSNEPGPTQSDIRRQSMTARHPVAHVPSLTPELIAAYRPQAAALSARIATRIQQEVSAFALAADPRIRDVITEAIVSAVDLFVDALAGAPTRGAKVDEFYHRLGRIEANAGRDLDAMQAAHYIASQESWEEVRRVTTELGQPPEVVGQLGDALLDYQNRLLQQAVVGFTEVRSNKHREREEARGRLMTALLSGASPEEIGAAALRCSWSVPEMVAVAATEATTAALDVIATTTDSLAGVQHGCLTIIADAASIEGITRTIARGATSPVAVSWAVAPEEARNAARWAIQALHLARQHIVAVPDDGILWCRDHQSRLCLHADPALRRHADKDHLAPLLAETAKRRVALAETMLLWLQTRQSAPMLAEQLHVHEQTVRHRLRHIKVLFGDRLTDPAQIVGLLTALESATPRWRDAL